mgnify:CR=1 FL=1
MLKGTYLFSTYGADKDGKNPGAPVPGANDAALDGFDAQTGTRVELEHAPAGEHNEGDDDGFRQQAAAMPTLREHLLTQLSLLNLTDRDRVLAQLLIDALDEDGYFTQDMTEILEMLPPEAAILRTVELP